MCPEPNLPASAGVENAQQPLQPTTPTADTLEMTRYADEMAASAPAATATALRDTVQPIGNKKSLRILAADQDPTLCSYYQETLPRLGHQGCVARTTPQLLELCHVGRPEMVIASGDLDGFD